MAASENEEGTSQAPASKKKPLLLALVIVGVLAIGFAGGYLMMPKHASKTGHESSESAAAPAHGSEASSHGDASTKGALYLPMDPPFVVNIRDGDSLRYLQVGITLMAHDASSLEAVKQLEPVIRDALLAQFGAAQYATVTDPAGRARMQTQALATVQKIVSAQLGRPGVDAVYFTSFVIQ